MLAIDKPVVILDSSATNALYDDSNRYQNLAKLRQIYFPRLTFSVLDELLATPDSYRNSHLFDVALSIQDAGDCLLPFNYLLVAHVRDYARMTSYDWKSVNCRGNGLKEMIVENRHELSASLVEEQRNHNLGMERQYKEEFKRIRNAVQLDPSWRGRFPSMEEFVCFALGEKGPYWRVAITLIRRALQIADDENLGGDSESKSSTATSKNLAEIEVTEEYARNVLEACPPFKSMLYGIVKSAYSRAHDLSLNSEARDKSAGRTDTFMACYLPYCRYFVTCDEGQFDCYNDVVQRVPIESTVMMYPEFWSKLPYH